MSTKRCETLEIAKLIVHSIYLSYVLRKTNIKDSQLAEMTNWKLCSVYSQTIVAILQKRTHSNLTEDFALRMI